MASDRSLQGNTPPPKPWEGVGSSSGPSPFKPPSSGNTSAVVEASGTEKTGAIVTRTAATTLANRTALRRPLLPPNYGNINGAFGSDMNYYNSGSFGSGMFSNGGRYASTGYGHGPFNGAGMHNNGLIGPMGGYRFGVAGGYEDQGPNDPNDSPASPPTSWISFLRVMYKVAQVFGRIAILVVQNTEAFHMLMAALLRIFDQSGYLYAEITRFVLWILGNRAKRKKHQLAPGKLSRQLQIEGPRVPTLSWDGVWAENGVSGTN